VSLALAPVPLGLRRAAGGGAADVTERPRVTKAFMMHCAATKPSALGAALGA
jgi:hypothetical protein